MQPTTTTQRPRQDAVTSTTDATKAPVKVIREGAIAASIWQRQGVNGTFYEYTLSRSWKSKDGEKSGYSHNFTARNAEQLAKVIEQATQYISERHPANHEPVAANDQTDIPY